MLRGWQRRRSPRSKGISSYVSLSDLRSMNGHAQSGGHWKAALRGGPLSSSLLIQIAVQRRLFILDILE